MKNIFFILSSFILTFSVFAQKSSGKVSAIKRQVHAILDQKSNRLISPQYLRLSTDQNEEIALEVVEHNSTIEGDHYYGAVAEVVNSSFRFMIVEDRLEGVVLMRDSKLAYELYSDSNGDVFVKGTDVNNVICTEYEVSAAPLAVDAVPPASSPVYKLQSNPTSRSVAYLDFDGQIVAGTLWAGGDSIVAQPGNFSEANIQAIFDLVSEDFSAFNVNVTTDQAVYDAAIRTSRMRCIFTPTNTASPGSGGVAYIGSFTWGDGIPCWVFNSGVRAAGEAASHELGHTLNLRHDGRTSPQQDYFSGHGNWGPIMGSTYTRAVVQWSNGEYNYANNKEDDISIITSRNGFSFKADDYGGTVAASAALVLEANGTVMASKNRGIIERRADIDVFRFTTTGGAVTFTATPAASHPNLDIKFDLLDPQGNVLISSNPTNMSATLNFNLGAGTYYLSIDGVGYNDPLTTGYSDYSSIGVYSISGTVPVSAPTNIMPNVNITTPTVGSTFDAPASINIRASAVDIDGTIQRVEFYNGNTKLGEDLTSPYEYNWNNVAIGNYNLTARATDNLGGTTTSSIVNVIVKKPDCKVANNKVLYDKVIGTAGSYQNNGNTISFVFDDDSLTYFDAPTASGAWAGIDMDGIYRITGIRYYPRASYGSRMNGGKFQGSNTPDFSSGVVDLATITSNPVVEWNCITVTNQSAFKYVRYLSPNTGNCNVAEVQFYGIKVANQDPIVVINTPQDQSVVYVPSATVVTVTATDPDGSITKVELYNGNEKIAEDISSPYQFTVQMDTSRLWTLVAKATDNVGEYTVSDTIRVIAKNPVCRISGTIVRTATILGTTGSYNNSGNTRDKAFDKDSSTFFDSPNANNSWVGLDLGSNKNIVGVRFYPRINSTSRMINGRIQVATNSTFTQGVINIDTIVKVYNDEWNCIDFPRLYNNRYVRYLSPNGGYGNIAEFEVYLQNVPPNVSFVNPVIAYNSLPANVVLNIAASDADGVITAVELYENNVKIANLTLNNGTATFNKTVTNPGTYVYYVKVTDDANATTNSANLQVVVNNVTDINDMELSDETFVLSPNPVSDRFSVTSVKAIEKVVLLDLQGKILKSYSQVGSTMSLPNEVGTGFYNIVVYFQDGEKANTKLLVTKE